MCISQGVFPSALKHAIVVPIHKTGDKSNLKNYRPISLLPCLSKLFEKCIKNRLINFLEKNNLLHENQFGFRRNLCTNDAIMSVTSKLIQELDAGNKCLGIFLDLQKAFDTVSHNVLLDKLDKMGIRGIALKLFSSYLSNRTQSTKINDHLSETSKVNIGIPQGTVLGPILFVIYLNDLFKIDVSKYSGSLHSYADDTVVIFSGLNWEETYLNSNKGINIIKEWLDANLLSLNISKTTLIPFSLTIHGLDHSDINRNVTIHNCNLNSCACPALNCSTQVKYLGIIVDQHLKWNKHISFLCNRLRKTIHKFSILRSYLPVNVLRIVYLALVQSIIQYGILGWGGIGKSNLTPLILLQKRIIKICLHKPLDYPTKLIYQEFGVLNIEQIYKYILLSYFQKNRNNFKIVPHCKFHIVAATIGQQGRGTGPPRRIYCCFCHPRKKSGGVKSGATYCYDRVRADGINHYIICVHSSMVSWFQCVVRAP